MPVPRYPVVALIAATALLAPRPASSQIAAGARVFGGYNTYAMGDWDDLMRELFVTPGSVATARDGYSLGVGAELAWGPLLVFTGSYERLVPGRMTEVNGEKLQFPANAMLLEVELRRRLRPRIRIGLGGGGGFYQLGEEVESPATERNVEGESIGAQLFALGEWEMTPAVSAGLDLGYRWARVDVHKVNRQNPSTELDVDYSGLHTRLVLRFNPKRPR